MSRALHDVATGTLFGVALNYQGLLKQRLVEFEQAPYLKPPLKPVLFIKTPNTRNQHEGDVIHPGQGERLQPGPALGVVMGKSASRVSADEALDYVAGYTVVNEFSLPEDSYYRPAVKAKCRDGFCTIGPDLVPSANPSEGGQRNRSRGGRERAPPRSGNRDQQRDKPPPVYGVSQQDTKRMELVLAQFASSGRTKRTNSTLRDSPRPSRSARACATTGNVSWRW